MKSKLDRYWTTTKEIRNKPGEWSGLLVEIFDDEKPGEDKKIGEYKRDYHALFNTFVPFTQDGEDFALFSDHYQSTKVMRLPDCVPIAVEKSPSEFCPVEYYVPISQAAEFGGRNIDGEEIIGPNGQFAFVSGCFWGDDSSWKIAAIDLQAIRAGDVQVSFPFGYMELPDDKNLADAIHFYPFSEKQMEENDIRVEVTGTKCFSLLKEKEEV